MYRMFQELEANFPEILHKVYFINGELKTKKLYVLMYHASKQIIYFSFFCII